MAYNNTIMECRMGEDDNTSIYIRMSEKFRGSIDNKRELVCIVYSMMESFVDRAFGVDAVQIVSESAQATGKPSNAFAPRAHPRRKRNGRARARLGGRRADSDKRRMNGGEPKCRKRA